MRHTDVEDTERRSGMRKSQMRIPSQVMNMLDRLYIQNDPELMNLIREHLTEREIRSKESDVGTDPHGQIIVLGACRVREDHLLGIAKRFGLGADRLVFVTNYKLQGFSVEKLRYNSRFALILIGPVDHRLPGETGFSSITSRLHSQPGFPPVRDLRSNNELKITKANFRSALADALEECVIVA